MFKQREKQLACWAGEQLHIAPPELTTVSGDASFRRYFRFLDQNRSIIAVDAPPKFEDNFAFHKTALLLKKFQLHVPDILAVDFELGFLLVSDLGNTLYLPALNPTNADELYRNAIDAILQMIEIPQSELGQIPLYSRQLLNDEMDLFDDWFINRHLNMLLSDAEKKVLKNTFLTLTENALHQPQHFVHRDFHSRNLMICEANQLGLIDFQDAVIGPVSYDLVSLLKDCYIRWPEQQIEQWCLYFYQKLHQQGFIKVDFPTFFKQFEFMGMQRHIKVLGIFCRLNYRDNKPNYLKDLQLTFDYLIEAVAKYPELEGFYQFLHQRIQPLLK